MDTTWAQQPASHFQQQQQAQVSSPIVLRCRGSGDSGLFSDFSTHWSDALSPCSIRAGPRTRYVSQCNGRSLLLMCRIRVGLARLIRVS